MESKYSGELPLYRNQIFEQSSGFQEVTQEQLNEIYKFFSEFLAESSFFSV